MFRSESAFDFIWEKKARRVNKYVFFFENFEANYEKFLENVFFVE